MATRAYEIMVLSFAICLILYLPLQSTKLPLYSAAFAETYGVDNYSIDSLFIALLTNGDASIDYNLIVGSGNTNANVSLFGYTVQNLTVTDYNGTSLRYSTTDKSNKITVDSQTSPNIHVSYITPDFVDKQDRNWTFSFSFGDKFLLKFPADARIISMQPQPYLTPTYEQNLWGFGPGDVIVKYIIGPLGTREEAQASIRLTEDDILQITKKYKGIVTTDVTGVIEKSKQAFEDGKYSDTVTYATLVDEMIKNLTNSYSVARKTISEAQIEIQSKKDSGDDISASEKFLKNARSLFSKGEYDNASSIAEQAMKQQNFRPTSSLNIDLVIAIVLILGTIGTIFLILGVRMDLFGRIKFKKDLDGQETGETSDGTTLDNPTLRMFPEEGIKPSEPKPRNLSSTPINAMSSSSVEEREIKEYMNQVVKEVNSVRMNALEEHTNKSPAVSSIPSVPPFSTMDKNRLAKIVSQMKSERPHLRPEEKELLDFLVEKNGLAFESELRSKFILPRTSLWRLVKRLEREEILEVTKIGGQNLIKLRV